MAVCWIAYMLRGRNPAQPADRDTWHRREILKGHEDEAKERVAMVFARRVSDGFAERKQRILSRARGLKHK